MGNSTELAPTLPSTKEAPGTPFHFQLPLWSSICIQQNGPSPWPVVLRIVAQGQVTTPSASGPSPLRPPLALTPGKHRSALSSAAIVLFMHTCYINGIIQYITSETHFLLSFSIVPLRPIRLVCMDGPFLMAGEWYSRMSAYQFVSPITH